MTARALVRTPDGRNVETDPSRLGGDRTATEDFFLRSHFPVPRIDPGSFRLAIGGAVARPVELDLDDLRRRSVVDTTLLLECAGNGRGLLETPVHGVQWMGGAVGSASWHGVPLADLLDLAGPDPAATHVILRGADSGEVLVDGAPMVTRFERSLPIGVARRPEVLVATGMNGAPLTPDHGAPVRAVVGGWYGVASVKWLVGIDVAIDPEPGHWESFDYAFHVVDARGTRRRVPVSEVQPKGQVLAPEAGARIRAGEPILVEGIAWAGAAAVARVEVSVDGGTTWSDAALDGAPRPLDWVRWRWTWASPVAGERAILVRCHDDRGRSQPDRRDHDRGTYMINHVLPHPVTVTEPG